MQTKALISNAAKAALKAPVHVYRWTLKPFVGWHCRHQPTCSDYALTAIETNGAWRGFWLMMSRLSRCHPWGTYGYDPVPDIGQQRSGLAPWRYGRWAWSGEIGLEPCAQTDRELNQDKG